MKYLKFCIDKLIGLLPKKDDECNITLSTIRSDNVNKLIFAHLNINSTRNKFEVLAMQV